MLTLEQWHARFLEQAGWSAALRRYIDRTIDINLCDSILEVGCGTGAVLQEYLKIGERQRQVIGVDLDAARVCFCSKNYPEIKCLCGDAYHLPVRSNSIDFAFCHYLLLWLRQPMAALSEVMRVVKRGGWIVAIAEPDHDGRIDWPDELDTLGKRQTDALIGQGIDPSMGRKLAATFVDAGIQLMEAGITGGQWKPQTLNHGNSMEWDVLQSDLDLSGDRIQAQKQLDLEARAMGSRVEFIPTFYAIGKKPID